MDINLMLEPRPAFSRNSFPQYTQAQTDTYSTTYSRLLKDAGPPSPPRWARKNISLKKKPLTDSKRRKVALAHTPWIQSAQGPLKRDYDTAVEPPPGSKGFSVAPFYPTSVTKVSRISLAEMKQPRPAQVAALHRQKSAMGIQNPTAERDRVRLSKFREMIDMQEGQRSFANFPPTINEKTVDNGFTVGTEHNISHQRPTTPPLTGFYKSSGPYSRIWKVNTPPALSPRHGITSTAKGPAQRIDVPPHLLYQEHMSPKPGESRCDADVRQAMTVYPPGDLIQHQQRGQQSRHLNAPVDANEPEIARPRQRQYQQERLAAQKQQQAGRASGSLSLRSSPEQTEPGGPQQSAGLAHQQAQQYHQMLMQQQQAIAMRDAQSQATNQAAVMAQQALQTFPKDNSNGLFVSPSSFAPEWGFGRDSNMPPSPLTFQTPVDPNGPSFAREDSTEGKRKTSDQGNMPVQPNDERHDSARTLKDTRILCSVYRFPQGRVQSTISEDHTTDVSKRRKLKFMALGKSNSYGAKIKQHPRRDAEPDGRMHALIKV